MKDDNLRTIMREAYLLLEQFETPSADAVYWDKLIAACNEFVGRWTGKYTGYASRLSAAVFDALEAELVEIHKKDVAAK